MPRYARPEILDKYDVLTRKLSGLQSTLERGYPTIDPQTGFLRHTSLREIAIIPTHPIPTGDPEFQFNTIMRTFRPPNVREADEAAVAHVNSRLRLENIADEVVNVRMGALIEQHDARVSSAVAIIEETSRRYNWQRREEGLEEELPPDISAANPVNGVNAGEDDDDDMEMVGPGGSNANPQPGESEFCPCERKATSPDISLH